MRGKRNTGVCYRQAQAFKNRIRLRDNDRCQLCGCSVGDACNLHYTTVRQLDVAHIIPWPAGPSTLENMRLICHPCNVRESYGGAGKLSQTTSYPRPSKLFKQRILERDGYRCHLCGCALGQACNAHYAPVGQMDVAQSPPSADELAPLLLPRPHDNPTVENMRATCHPCNVRERYRTVGKPVFTHVIYHGPVSSTPLRLIPRSLPASYSAAKL